MSLPQTDPGGRPSTVAAVTRPAVHAPRPAGGASAMAEAVGTRSAARRPALVVAVVLGLALAFALPGLTLGASGARPRAVAEGVRGPVRSSPPAPAATAILLRPASAAPVPAAPGIGSPVAAATGPIVIAASPSACVDGAWRSTGGRWYGTYTWAFRGASTPAGIAKDAVATVLRRSVTNITGARNDCGRLDDSEARARYAGRTDRRPGVTRAGKCGDTDGWNVVGFGALPGDYLGITCIWTIGDRIVEADMRLDASQAWATSLAGCSGAVLLESVATHEFGHAFGLGHVGELNHGLLTMSVRINGDCQATEATLGLGDMLALESLYP